MVKYRLLKDHADANKMITMPLFFVLLFLAISGVFLLLSSIFSPKFSVFAGLAFLLSFFLGIEGFFNSRIFGLYARMEEDTLIVCTHRGRILRRVLLQDMNEKYAFVHYGRSMVAPEKSLVLIPKGMRVNFSWMKDPTMLWFDWKSCNYKKRKQLVIIVNKELEEKILAYYGEPITEPDSTV